MFENEEEEGESRGVDKSYTSMANPLSDKIIEQKDHFRRIKQCYYATPQNKSANARP